MKNSCLLFLFISSMILTTCQVKNQVLIPTIDGDWWQIAGDPDLGDYTSPEQQPVDFGVWQAPHVIKVENTYYMFYGDWGNICLAESQDGKKFTRILNEEGTPALFSGPYGNTRDPWCLNTRICTTVTRWVIRRIPNPIPPFSAGHPQTCLTGVNLSWSPQVEVPQKKTTGMEVMRNVLSWSAKMDCFIYSATSVTVSIT